MFLLIFESYVRRTLESRTNFREFHFFVFELLDEFDEFDELLEFWLYILTKPVRWYSGTVPVLAASLSCRSISL